MRIIDLSVPLSGTTPISSADKAVRVTQSHSLEKDGFIAHELHLETHHGTHIDAPAHMLASGASLASFPLNRFFTRIVYVPALNGYDLSLLESLTIEPGDAVLFHTGSSDRYGSQEYFTDYPEMSNVVAEYLAKKEVGVVGIDGYSIDKEPYPEHHYLLSRGILLLENLTNVEAVRDGKYLLCAFPLRVDLDGSPVRAVAIEQI